MRETPSDNERLSNITKAALIASRVARDIRVAKDDQIIAVDIWLQTVLLALPPGAYAIELSKFREAFKVPRYVRGGYRFDRPVSLPGDESGDKIQDALKETK